MDRFRKKPVVIEAEQYHFRGPITPFLAEAFCDKPDLLAHPHIHTLEGVTYPSDLDWIVKGVQGEFYPVKAPIFAATYEPVEESEGK